ncbi:MAG: hypothetical protein KAS35_00115 [Candidatus Marinimicrobia bacterium]|jgi:hypothetical protein|nr:hypothetical protein [Candidatus Neomarinimicrobiota bacterium]
MKYTAFKFILFLPLIIFSQVVEPIYITLNGDITNPDQEVSGLTWYKDNLILLPQYPTDKIYSIPKQQIIDFLDSSRTTILPKEIKWNSSGLDKRIGGFEGYESIIFNDDTVYITIEAKRHKINAGFIARGIIDTIKNEININKKSLKEIKTPVMLLNMTYETILISNNSVITIYEVNSAKVNKSPVYHQFDKNLKSDNITPFPFTEYRITDATEIDNEGKFWVTNYFWPGDYNLLKLDLNYPIMKKKDIKPVERLLEFQIVNENIVRTETPPISIKLSEFDDSRNWEGIVRLDDKGFLIVTDKFPGTILAFIPFTE